MFVTDLVLRSQRGTYDYVVDESLIWEAGDGSRIEVPAGYRTDLASVPWPLWALFPPSGRYRDAAVIHDYLLTEGAVSRREADALFYEAMADLKIPPWRRLSLWASVRGYGWMKGVLDGLRS